MGWQLQNNGETATVPDIGRDGADVNNVMTVHEIRSAASYKNTKAYAIRSSTKPKSVRSLACRSAT